MHAARNFERIPALESSIIQASRHSARRTRAVICPLALVSADLLAFALAAILAFVIVMVPEVSPYARALNNVTLLGAGWHGWGTLLVLVSLLGYFGSRGHYTARVPGWTQLGDAVVATAVALACDIFLTVAIYQRPIMLEGLLRWVLFCPCLVLLRAAARETLRAAGVWSLRTLIVAGAGEIETAKAALTSDATLGYIVSGTVTPELPAELSDDEVSRWLASQGIDFVVIAVGGTNPTAERAVLETLRRTGLPIALVPALQGVPVVGFRPHYFLGHDIVMLVSRSNLAQPFSRALKTAFDQSAAVVLILLFAPLLLSLALLVRADGGPALYRHRRIGSGGRVFDCIKFRSMVVDADGALRRLLESDPAAAKEWEATQKLRRDPRITPIGRFLRRSSLDELPQLLNVLRGEMSLVGPRPIVQAEVARYADDIEYYYAAKPGLTGLWQVSGRSDMSYTRRVKLDVWYVRNWTLWHDIVILFRTIPAVFLQRGAH